MSPRGPRKPALRVAFPAPSGRRERLPMGAPAPVDAERLKALHIRLAPPQVKRTAPGGGAR